MAIPKWMRWTYREILRGTPIEHIRFMPSTDGIWLSIDPYPHPDTKAATIQEFLDMLQSIPDKHIQPDDFFMDMNEWIRLYDKFKEK